MYGYAKAARGAAGCIGVVKETALDSIGHHLRMQLEPNHAFGISLLTVVPSLSCTSYAYSLSHFWRRRAEAPSEDFISPAASIMSNLASDQGLRGKVSHEAFLFLPVTWLSILCTTPSLSSPGLTGSSFLNPRTLCVLATKAFRNAATSEVPSLSKQGLKKHHSRIRATCG